MSRHNGNGHLQKTARETKGKVVKPSLRRKLQSEKTSLDLDRPATEQYDGLGIYGFGAASRSAQNVTFTHTRRGYHNRSTSGASQFSTATSGSGNRAGSFVHPFQQTPRPYTPPITSTASHQNSLRDYEQHSYSNSPALTEDEDSRPHQLRNHSSLSKHHHHHHHRSSSLTGTPASTTIGTQPLRLQTKQPSISRLARTSHTSLSSTPILSSETSTPADTMSPTSALRTSVDRGFRIRSRSDVNPAESIQDARRRWDEYEKGKDEIAAREEIKALEKRNRKEARRAERAHRRSSTSSRNKQAQDQEKIGIYGREYSTVADQATQDEMDGYEPERRPTVMSNTKKKTHSTWTKFMMWIRTRFIRLGNKKYT